MKTAVLCLMLMACTRHVKFDPIRTGYRITRDDGAILIVQYPGRTRSLEELRDEFCKGQVCVIETISIRPEKVK